MNDDLISRQGAIDAMIDEFKRTPTSAIRAKFRLEALSPAQTKNIQCKDCRWRKDQSGSTAWLPCRAIITPSDFSCCRAERRGKE